MSSFVESLSQSKINLDQLQAKKARKANTLKRAEEAVALATANKNKAEEAVTAATAKKNEAEEATAVATAKENEVKADMKKLEESIEGNFQSFVSDAKVQTAAEIELCTFVMNFLKGYQNGHSAGLVDFATEYLEMLQEYLKNLEMKSASDCETILSMSETILDMGRSKEASILHGMHESSVTAMRQSTAAALGGYDRKGPESRDTQRSPPSKRMRESLSETEEQGKVLEEFDEPVSGSEDSQGQELNSDLMDNASLDLLYWQCTTPLVGQADDYVRCVKDLTASEQAVLSRVLNFVIERLREDPQHKQDQLSGYTVQAWLGAMKNVQTPILWNSYSENTVESKTNADKVAKHYYDLAVQEIGNSNSKKQECRHRADTAMMTSFYSRCCPLVSIRAPDTSTITRLERLLDAVKSGLFPFAMLPAGRMEDLNQIAAGGEKKVFESGQNVIKMCTLSIEALAATILHVAIATACPWHTVPLKSIHLCRDGSKNYYLCTWEPRRRDAFTSNSPVPREALAPYLIQLVRFCFEVQRKLGVCHRDLKPENVVEVDCDDWAEGTEHQVGLATFKVEHSVCKLEVIDMNQASYGHVSKDIDNKSITTAEIFPVDVLVASTDDVPVKCAPTMDSYRTHDSPGIGMIALRLMLGMKASDYLDAHVEEPATLKIWKGKFHKCYKNADDFAGDPEEAATALLTKLLLTCPHEWYESDEGNMLKNRVGSHLQDDVEDLFKSEWFRSQQLCLFKYTAMEKKVVETKNGHLVVGDSTLAKQLTDDYGSEALDFVLDCLHPLSRFRHSIGLFFFIGSAAKEKRLPAYTPPLFRQFLTLK